MSADLLYTWLLVFLRALGIVLFIPQMAGRSPPVMVRLGLALCLATLISGMIAPAAIPASVAGLVFAAVGEVAVGLVLGFVVQIVFQAVDMAGRTASSEIGLSASPGMGTPAIATEPLAGFLSAFAVVLFFLFGGHLAVISAFASSFRIAPAGHAAFNPYAGMFMIDQTAHLVELGLRLAAPFIALNFLVTLAFSVLARAVPRIGVFILSYPVRGLAGLGLFSGAGALLARYLYGEFSALPVRMLQMLGPR
ncbi:MAG: flagellar biosynthetic protein FliR [Opitutaceae bacterium]